VSVPEPKRQVLSAARKNEGTAQSWCGYQGSQNPRVVTFAVPPSLSSRYLRAGGTLVTVDSLNLCTVEECASLAGATGTIGSSRNFALLTGRRKGATVEVFLGYTLADLKKQRCQHPSWPAPAVMEKQVAWEATPVFKKILDFRPEVVAHPKVLKLFGLTDSFCCVSVFEKAGQNITVRELCAPVF
jgi:hypothetical protein